MSDDVFLKKLISMVDIEREVIASGGTIRNSNCDNIHFVATKGPVDKEYGSDVFIWVTKDRLMAKAFSRYHANDPSWFIEMMRDKFSINVSLLDLDPGNYIIEDDED